MRIKTKDLIGAALDWAVAKALGWVDFPDDSIEEGRYWHTDAQKAPFGPRLEKSRWNPSTDPANSWPIIDREKISLVYQTTGRWWAFFRYGEGLAEMQLVAAMRCYVVSKLGEDIEVPSELLRGQS